MTDKKIIQKLKDDKHYYGDFGKQFLSNSDIQSLVLEPRQFHAPQPDNKNFVDGRYFHQLILEPNKVKDFKVCDASSRNSKTYKEYLIENNLEHAILEKETHQLKNMRDYMLGNLQFSDFINDPTAKYEVVSVKEIMGVKWKGKADIVTDTHVFDIKTSSDVFKFPRNAINYFYHTQAYIYQELFEKPVVFLVIGKNKKKDRNNEEYYDLGVFPMKEDTMSLAEETIVRAITTYKKWFAPDSEENIDNYIINTRI